MKSNLLCAIAILTLFSCGKRLTEIEHKNDNGLTIEKYYINQDSLKFGTYTSYDQDGILFEKSQYKKGELDGLRTIFYSSGEVEIQENYKAGVINGLYKSFYENGNVNLEANYIDGKMEGKVKRYYSSGELLEEVMFVGNQENGAFKEYYKNSQVKWEGQYKDGDNEVGTILSYDEKGELIKKMECGKFKGEYICQTSWTIEEGEKELVLEYED